MQEPGKGGRVQNRLVAPPLSPLLPLSRLLVGIGLYVSRFMFPTPLACVLKIFCIPFTDSSWMRAGTLWGRVVGMLTCD